MKSVLVAAAVLACSTAATAAPVLTFTASSGSLSASAVFDLVGTTLHVTVTNTGASDVLLPNEVLTGIFFNVDGNPTLTRLGVTTLGATSLGGTLVSDAGADVGGEWAYLNGLSQYGANSGISSSSLGIFGAPDLFPPGTNLAGPISPNGLQYGLTSAGDNLGTGNGAVIGNELTKSAVEITLGGFMLPLSSISDVTFQYGTALTDGHIGGADSFSTTEVPEPGSFALAALAMGAGWFTRRGSRRAS
jgi:hypothetical protein